MAGSQRDRRKMSGAERRKAAAEAARRRRQRRRFGAIGAGVLAVIVAIVAVVVLTKDDDKKKTDVAAGNTSTTAAGTPAADKVCVAVADPLPAGAPAVPVKVGPGPTQLVKEDLKEGTGATVNPNDTVTVNYIGAACTTGKIFDSSYSRNEPATFPLNQVIKGWTDGIPGMKVGGQRLLGIPSDQAYGAQGRPPDIGPDEPLWFVVEVQDAKPT
ncbi:MAG TPA: FKBP-type peptidyl-prolyl cis-trans isomerase [Acidimicrobiales bacterium]|nr:FKBP-type peptidyl-prolyl cis-trans isomerase [Acidimicrobiales bacterium]